MEMFDLGWGTTFDISNVYPNYQNLSEDNFVFAGMRKIDTNISFSIPPYINELNFNTTKLYNQNTGVFTVKFNSTLQPQTSLADYHCLLIIFDNVERILIQDFSGNGALRMFRSHTPTSTATLIKTKFANDINEFDSNKLFLNNYNFFIDGMAPSGGATYNIHLVSNDLSENNFESEIKSNGDLYININHAITMSGSERSQWGDVETFSDGNVGKFDFVYIDVVNNFIKKDGVWKKANIYKKENGIYTKAKHIYLKDNDEWQGN